jgi:predicted dehydrogenase
MSKVLRIGVVGCGYMSQMVHLPCLRSLGNVEVVGLCDVREDVASALCSRWGIASHTASLEELLGMGVDAVYVLTPVQCHSTQIKAALSAGKAVFTEKPAAMAAASVQALKRVCGSGGRVMVGYMKRHESNLQALQKLRRERDWGRLQFIRMHSFIGRHWNAAINDLVPVVSSNTETAFDLSQLDPGPAWLKSPRDPVFYSFDHPYYGLLDTGCHSINLLRFLAESEGKVLSVRNKAGVRLVELDFEGTPGVLEFCVNFRMHRWDEVAELYFEKASVRILTPPPLSMQEAAVVEIYSEDGDLRENLRLGNNHQWAFRTQAKTFVEKVLSGEHFSDLADAEKDLELIEKIYQLEQEI